MPSTAVNVIIAISCVIGLATLVFGFIQFRVGRIQKKLMKRYGEIQEREKVRLESGNGSNATNLEGEISPELTENLNDNQDMIGMVPLSQRSSNATLMTLK